MIDKPKISELNKELSEINIKIKKVRLKFNNLFESRRKKLISKKDLILNKIKTRKSPIFKISTSVRTLYKQDPLYKNLDEINKKIKLLKSKIDQLFLKKTSKLQNIREKVINELKKYSKNKPKRKKIKIKRNPRPKGTRRSSQIKPANVKGSFQLLRSLNSKPTPINRLAAKVTGFKYKK